MDCESYSEDRDRGSSQGSGPFRPALRARRRPWLGVPEGAGPPARPGAPLGEPRAPRPAAAPGPPNPAHDSPPRPPPPPPPLGPPQATATAVAPSPARELPSLLPHRPPPPPLPPSRCVTAPCVTAPGPAPAKLPRASISRHRSDESHTRQRAARAAGRAGGEHGGRPGPGGEASDGGWLRAGRSAPCSLGLVGPGG